ncbi:MAG: glycosyltransferase 87 family protein, partial [Albidovulum sp.]
MPLAPASFAQRLPCAINRPNPMTNNATNPSGFLPALSAPQDRTLALMFLALWSAATIILQWNIWPEDLSAVYIAAALWQQGQPDLIYAIPFGFYGGTAAEWIPIQEQLGIYDLGSFPYVYPPLWAVLTAPLTAVFSPQGFANAVTCLQVPMLAASVWLAMRILPLPGAQLWLKSAIGVVLLSTMVPAFTALWFNNPSITVNFLTLLAFERLTARHPIAAGAALALAAAIKLSP